MPKDSLLPGRSRWWVWGQELAGPVWIYTSPSVGSSEWPVIVPVGLVVAGGGLLVSAEGGMMYSTTEGMLLGVGAVAAGLSF